MATAAPAAATAATAATAVHKKKRPVQAEVAEYDGGDADYDAGPASGVVVPVPTAKKPRTTQVHADAAPDAAPPAVGDRPPRKKPGPKPGFKRNKPAAAAATPAAGEDGEAAGVASAEPSAVAVPSVATKKSQAAAPAAATEPAAASSADDDHEHRRRMPLVHVRVVVGKPDLRFILKVTAGTTVGRFRTRTEQHFHRLYPELADRYGRAWATGRGRPDVGWG